MTGNLALGICMILITGLVHTLLTATVLGLTHRWDEWPDRPTIARAVLRVDLVILLAITATIAEAAIWASGFLLTGALSGFEEALYFSVTTYTTLGYGDIVLPDQWRLLSSIEFLPVVLCGVCVPAAPDAALSHSCYHPPSAQRRSTR